MSAITAGQRGRAAARPPAPSDPATARTARRHRIALLALLAVTLLLYLYGLGRNGWANDFYSAAVQAGTKSWKAFFFGSFDAENFITVDKTPASLWVMELSGRIFGLNYWSLLVPQALEGVASVALLYAAVKRWHGPAAGLLAGAALAITPVAALMFRYNNPDALLVLLMTAAAYGTVRAVESGRTRWLVLAGTLLGFGFLTKMLQAFLVLPVFGLVYLVAGPRRLPVRLLQLGAGLVAVLVAAGWWVAAVMLTPAADRPYVGGSTNDSILQLALGYNGLGRLDGNETGSVGFSAGRGGGSPSFSGAAGLSRLFAADMGGQISWLIPAALVGMAALLWLSLARTSGRTGRLDRDRASVLLWGGWLIVTGVVFSYMQGIIHPYYTIALAPAIAALAAVAAVRLWQSADRWQSRAFLAAGVGVTAVWSCALLNRTPDWLPWLRYCVLICGLGAAGALLVADRLGAVGSPRSPDRLGAVSSPRGPHGVYRRQSLVAAAIVVPAVVAGLAGPLAYTADTIGTAHTGALPSAGPAVAAGFGGGPGGGGFPGGGAPGAGRTGSGSTGTGSTRLGQVGTRPGGSGTQGGPSGLSGTSSGRGGFPAGGMPGSGRGTGGAPGGGGRTGGLPGSGASRSGGRSGPGGAGGPGGLGGSTTVSSALTRLLEQHSGAYTWAAATVGSESAAPLQLATDLPIMSIGGFNGTDPWPTLAAFKLLVSEHKIHYFVGTNSDSFGGGTGDAAAISSWVAAHYRAETVGGVTVYNLTTPKT
jgi:4-amino-4-deoxy-L-arabinose transferase-like glycosyltransferase